MSTATETDLGPLIWVKAEIDASLARAQEALGKYAANPAETAQLKFAQSHLHQAHGALAIVGLDGVTQFADALEMFFADIEKGNIAGSHTALDLAHNALTALRHYLDELVNGSAHQPLKLWPLYESIQTARRATQISAADLFFPDLSARPPKRNVEHAVAAEELPRLLREARSRFERGFLGWLRTGKSGANDMREAVAAVERLQTAGSARSFWWATLALADALSADTVVPEIDLRRLWGRIGTQMRRTAGGSRNIAERLNRDVLYHVAVAPPVSEALREAKAIWQLDALVPRAGAAVDITPLKPVLRGVKDAIQVAKEAWNRFCAGAAVGLPQFAEQIANIAARAEGLPEPALVRLTGAVNETAQWLRKAPLKHNESVAMEVATALLLIETAAENFEELDSDYPRQANLMSDRLALLKAGGRPDPMDTPLLGEMSRRAQEKLFMSQVAREILNNLAVVEQTLDGYFRDPGRSAELAALGAPIKQIEGALTILGQDSAADLLRECDAKIARLFAASEPPEQSAFEDLAHKLSGLGFFVDALQHGPADLDAILYPERKSKLAAPDAEEQAPSVETELQNRMGAAQALVEALRVRPQDEALRGELKASLETIREEASLVDNARLEQQARDALNALKRGVQAPPVADLVPEKAAPAAGPAAEQIDQTQEEIDAELLEIFIEEAHEVLATVGEHLAASRAEPHNHEAITTIRRGFHTLKGSGRMVGLKELGEVAWSVEQVMNRWLQREEDANDALHQLVAMAHGVFSDWVKQLETQGNPHLDASALVAMAAALDGGEAPPPAAAAPQSEPAPDAGSFGEDTLIVPLMDSMLDESVMTAPGGEVIDLGDESAVDDQEVRVGDFALARNIYEMYLNEARQHLGVLRHELARLHLNPAVLPAEPTVRAAHTLAGISGTVGFGSLHDLARSLENAMARMSGRGVPASGNESELLNHAASTLDGMLSAIAERRQPVPARELASQLDRLVAHAALASTEIFPLELEELVEESPEPTSLAETETFTVDLGEPMDDAPAAQTVAGEPAEASLATTEIFPLDIGALAGDVPEASSPAEPTKQTEVADSPLDLDIFPLELEQEPDDLPLAAQPAATAVDLAQTLVFPIERYGLAEDEPPVAADAEAKVVPPQVLDEPEIPPLDLDLLSHDQGDTGAPPELLLESEGAADLDLELNFESLEADEPAIEAPAESEPEISLDTARDLDLGALPQESEREIAAEPPAHSVQSAASPTEAEALVEAPQGSSWQVAAREADLQHDELAEVQSSEPLIAPAASVEQTAEGPSELQPQDEPSAEAGEKRKMRLQDELDESLLPIFLEEAHDLSREINEQVRRWKETPTDTEIARSLKRLLHTLKGSSRMAGAMALGELVHSMETRVEDALAQNAFSQRFFDDLDTSLDRSALLIEHLQSGTEPEPAAPEALAPTTAEATTSEVAAQAKTAPETVSVAAARPRPTPAVTAPPRAPEADIGSQLLRVRADLVDRFANEAGEMAIARSRIEGEMRTLRHSLLDLTDNVIRLRGHLHELEIQAESQMQSRLAQAEAQHADFDPLEIDRFTRLQELTRMIAESVNDVSTVQHNVLRNLDQADAALVSQGRLNRDLQQALMSVRMVPFSSVADRLHRIIRQTAKELGKKATLDIQAGQTELDRGVLDKMVGPLEHLLRNALGHGLETPEQRLAAGKPEIGQITVSLAQEGNEIAIYLADDGQGLNYANIRRKAIENGQLDADVEVDDADLADMIFQPGFSTAGEVSAISGRGVGMDVVKSAALSLGGRVDVSSEAGRGTTFRVYLPLSLAVMQALIVRAAGRSYAIPSSMVAQVLELKTEPMEAIQREGSTDWLGNSFPYRYLPRLLGDYESRSLPARYHWLLLTHAGNQRVAVQVDELKGNQEIVVKKTGGQLARVIGIAGATVLGDGEIVLILNPVALASRESRHHVPETVRETASHHEPETTDTRPTVMVVDDSLTVRKITGRLLEREGYRVVTAKDGVDALEHLLDVLPDVMLVDIEMPRMDGFDLTRNVRGDERLKAVPIVMITSRIADKHRNYAKEIGVDHYLGKPYNEEELLSIIADYTRQAARLH